MLLGLTTIEDAVKQEYGVAAAIPILQGMVYGDSPTEALSGPYLRRPYVLVEE